MDNRIVMGVIETFRMEGKELRIVGEEREERSLDREPWRFGGEVESRGGKDIACELMMDSNPDECKDVKRELKVKFVDLKSYTSSRRRQLPGYRKV